MLLDVRTKVPASEVAMPRTAAPDPTLMNRIAAVDKADLPSAAVLAETILYPDNEGNPNGAN
jgi:hypothetical protein